jgi:hypothetical protein
MRPRFCLFALVLLAALPMSGQQSPLNRDQTRELLRASLNRYGSLAEVNINFRQSEKEPYNFVGTMTAGLKNSQALEVVINVSAQNTIHLRVFPHYNGSYVNLDKARDTAGLMRKLLDFSNRNFLFWGADDTFDVFAGYNFTLESGYPEAAISTVLRSIRTLDQYVGELRPLIDGSSAAP